MPMPWTYRHASREWAAILSDARDRMGLSSDNMVYTALEGTLHAFRRRLTVQQAVDFAAILPAIPRAIFVSDWDTGTAPVPFADRATLLAEVRALRPHHNIAPDTAIEAVAFALRRAIDPADFERVMARLPEGARDFWNVPGATPEELRPRIV